MKDPTNSIQSFKILVQSKMEVDTALNCKNIGASCTQKNMIKTCRTYSNYTMREESICTFKSTKSAVKDSTSIVNSKDYEHSLCSKLYSVINLYVEQIINCFNLLHKKKRKESYKGINAEWISHPTKIFVFLVSLVFILQLLPLVSASKPLGNPYKILGVSKQATIKEIRKAYLNLVKEW